MDHSSYKSINKRSSPSTSTEEKVYNIVWTTSTVDAPYGYVKTNMGFKFNSHDVSANGDDVTDNGEP